MADEQGTSEPKNEKTPTKSNLPFLMGILIALLIIAGGYYGWQAWQQAQQEESSNQATPTPVPTETSTEDETAEPTTPATVTISESLRENIEAAINTMNTAALEGYMTNPVTVVLAASEKGGPVTPTQAVTDLDYLSSATAPWDWNLSAATLASYKNGFYGQYFGENTVVGKSANGYVVSFTVNASNKIATIFMAASSDLLTQ